MGTATSELVSSGTQTHAMITGAGGPSVDIVMVTITMSSSYATGGETLTLPASIKGKQLRAVHLINRHDGTRVWEWDGSTTTPKLKAYDAFATEEGAGTNVSSVTLKALLIYGG